MAVDGRCLTCCFQFSPLRVQKQHTAITYLIAQTATCKGTQLMRNRCSESGGVLIKLEFLNLSVQGSPADFEHPGRFLLVPPGGLEHAHDVGPFGLAQ